MHLNLNFKDIKAGSYLQLDGDFELYLNKNSLPSKSSFDTKIIGKNLWIPGSLLEANFISIFNKEPHSLSFVEIDNYVSWFEPSTSIYWILSFLCIVLIGLNMGASYYLAKGLKKFV